MDEKPADPEFGEWLHTVRENAACPVHNLDMPMHVFERGVRWACGHGRWLPPVRKQAKDVTVLRRAA